MADNNYAGPDDLVEAFFTYLGSTQNDHTTLAKHFETKMPHLKDLVSKLVQEAFRASLQSEEGRAVRLQLFFDSVPQQVTLPFDSPIEYTAQNLVKLAPTIDLGFRWLVVAHEPPPENTEPKIFGICDPTLSPSQQLLLPTLKDLPGLKLSVLGPGWVRLETWGEQTFDLHDCQIDRPCTINIIPGVRAWYKDAVKVLCTPTDIIDPLHFPMLMGLIGATWVNILKKVCEARHGGTFLVVPDGHSLGDRLRTKYSVDSTLLREVMKKRGGFKPYISYLDMHSKSRHPTEIVQDEHLLERDMAQISDLIATLAAIDGAVVLQRNLKIIGFGAEILPRTEDQSSSGPFAHRGMRHRSAYRFCKETQGSLAFIVSQDGGVTLILNNQGEVDDYKVATPEHGWVIPSTKSPITSQPSLRKSKLDGKEQQIQGLLSKQVPKASIAKAVGVSVSTLRHFIRTRKLELQAKP